MPMRGVIKALVCVAWVACLSLRAQTGPGPESLKRFDNQANLEVAQALGPAVDREVRALEEFERKTGTRIVVQFHAKSPPEAEDKVPGAYMSALSTKMGLIEKGILVVYFADDPDWRIWFGNQVAPVFAGKLDKTAPELTKDGSIHEAKEAFLAKCHTEFLETYKISEPKGTTTSQNPVGEGLIIASRLMERLGPKP